MMQKAPPQQRSSPGSGRLDGGGPTSPLAPRRILGARFLLASASFLAAAHTIRVLNFACITTPGGGGEHSYHDGADLPRVERGMRFGVEKMTSALIVGGSPRARGGAPVRRRVVHLAGPGGAAAIMVPSGEGSASHHRERERERQREAVPSTRSSSSSSPPPLPKFDAAVDPSSSSTSSRDCVPYVWQTLSFPTCNNVHEVDMRDVPGTVTKRLGSGGIRDVWKIVHNTTQANKGGSPSSSSLEAVALKTLKMSRPFSPFFQEMHRKDALAMERLTPSSHVVDIYDYCGQSAINELVATDGKKRLRGSATPMRKLGYARDAALALADVHGIDDGHRGGVDRTGTLVHGDITMSNYVLSSDRSSLQLSDFNQARFLSWNNRTQIPCGYRRLHCTAARSPEECTPGGVLTEKTDVYTLGHVLYFLLSAHLPYRYPTKLESRLVRKLMTNGTLPQLPPSAQKSRDPATVAVREAMARCYVGDHGRRPGAAEIASDLTAALEAISGR